MGRCNVVVVAIVGAMTLGGGAALAQQAPINRGGAPSMPFESLFQIDENGEIVPVEGSMDLRALYNNGMVGEISWENCLPAIKEWRDKIDRLTTENIDLVVDLDLNALPNYDQDDTNELMYVNTAVQLLISAKSLTDYLNDAGCLTRIQSTHNRRIVSDYQQRYMTWAAQAAQEKFPDDTTAQMQFITAMNYREALRDVFETYEGILHAMVTNPEDIDPDLAAEFAEGETVDQKIHMLKKALHGMEYAEQKEAVQSGLPLRPVPEYAQASEYWDEERQTIYKPGQVRIMTPEETREAVKKDRGGGR